MVHNRRSSVITRNDMEVIFEGSKTFWKIRLNVDLFIVFHQKFKCLEIIAYNPDQGIEAPRLYLNYFAILQHFDQAEVQRVVAEKKEAAARQKKPWNSSESMKEIMNNMVGQYVLSHLQVNSADPFQVVVTALTTNNDDFTITQPAELVPTEVALQKKTSSQAISNAINNLEQEAVALKRATKMAELVTSSVDGFNLMLQEQKRLQRNMRPAKLRWMKAIRRVLAQNFANKIRARLGMELTDPFGMNLSLLREMEQEQLKAPRKPKFLRRSLDSAFNVVTAAAEVNGGAGPATIHLPSITTTHHFQHYPAMNQQYQKSPISSNSESVLPSLPSPSNHFLKPSDEDTSQVSMMSTRRREKREAKKAGEGRILSRHSLNGSNYYSALYNRVRRNSKDESACNSVYNKKQNLSLDSAEAHLASQLPSHDSLGELHVPSLVESYKQYSNKLTEPLLHTAMLDIHDPFSFHSDSLSVTPSMRAIRRSMIAK